MELHGFNSMDSTYMDSKERAHAALTRAFTTCVCLSRTCDFPEAKVAAKRPSACNAQTTTSTWVPATPDGMERQPRKQSLTQCRQHALTKLHTQVPPNPPKTLFAHQARGTG
eukprot:scaffold576_cov260-Pinguiococcus_pyrenoidosus.AAC.62